MRLRKFLRRCRKWISIKMANFDLLDIVEDIDKKFQNRDPLTESQ